MEGYVQSISKQAVAPANIESGACFMCGREASTGKGEHVFPRWLQRRFDLYNQSIGLLNRTTIPYRSLTSPCCNECNTGPLAKLERETKEAIETLPTENLALRIKLAQWLFKILLGIVFKEARLHRDRTKPTLGMIFPPEYVDELFSVHLLVNSIRKLTLFRSLHGPLPFTIYLYRIHSSEHFSRYDFSTNLFGKSVAIRMDGIAAIAVADGGLQNHIGKKGPFELDGKTLHPLQFSEIAGRVHYKSTLRDATHLYMNSETEDHLRIEQVRVTPYSNKLLPDGSQRIFRTWEERELSMILDNYTRVPGWFDEVTGYCRTTLVEADGKFISDPNKIDSMLGIV